MPAGPRTTRSRRVAVRPGDHGIMKILSAPGLPLVMIQPPSVDVAHEITDAHANHEDRRRQAPIRRVA